eukprot:2045619-Pleurochrysis_carterae.AAC.1
MSRSPSGSAIVRARDTRTSQSDHAPASCTYIYTYVVPGCPAGRSSRLCGHGPGWANLPPGWLSPPPAYPGGSDHHRKRARDPGLRPRMVEICA